MEIIIALLGVVIAAVGVVYFLKKKKEDSEIIQNLFSDRKFLVEQNQEYAQRLTSAFKEIEKLKKNKK